MSTKKHLHPLHKHYLHHRKIVAQYVGGENLFELKIVIVVIVLSLLYRWTFIH